MITAANHTPVQLPDLSSIRNRLSEIDREANFLRKLLRLVGKQASTSNSEKGTISNTSR